MNIMLVRHGNIINTTGGEAKSDNREISSTIATIKILQQDRTEQGEIVKNLKIKNS